MCRGKNHPGARRCNSKPRNYKAERARAKELAARRAEGLTITQVADETSIGLLNEHAKVAKAAEAAARTDEAREAAQDHLTAVRLRLAVLRQDTPTPVVTTPAPTSAPAPPEPAAEAPPVRTGPNHRYTPIQGTRSMADFRKIVAPATVWHSPDGTIIEIEEIKAGRMTFVETRPNGRQRRSTIDFKTEKPVMHGLTWQTRTAMGGTVIRQFSPGEPEDEPLFGSDYDSHGFHKRTGRDRFGYDRAGKDAEGRTRVQNLDERGRAEYKAARAELKKAEESLAQWKAMGDDEMVEYAEQQLRLANDAVEDVTISNEERRALVRGDLNATLERARSLGL